MRLSLEMVTVPVADGDRAKAFYVDQVGFHADIDVRTRRRPSVRTRDPAGIGVLRGDRRGMD